MNRRMTLIGVVLRKDLQTLWPLAAVVIVLQLLRPFFSQFFWFGIFNPSTADMAVLLASVLFAFAALHADPTASTRHDWLIRPIRRLDLVFAKIILLFGVVWAPLVIGAIAFPLAIGLPLGEALLRGSGEIVWLALMLPVLAFAAVTGGLVATLAGLICLMVAFVALMMASLWFQDRFAGAAIQGSGVYWPNPWLFLAALAVGCGLALWLQYAHRRTQAARTVLVAVAVAGGVIFVSRPLTATAGAEVQSAAEIGALAVCHRSLSTPADPAPFIWSDALANYTNWSDAERLGQPGRSRVVVASGRVTGLPQGWTAAAVRLEARLGGSNSGRVPRGGTILRTDSHGSGGANVLTMNGFTSYINGLDPAFDAPPPDLLASSWLTTEEGLAAAGERFELNARLALMKPARTYRIPSDGRRRRLKGLGYCSARPLSTGPTLVECVTAWPRPAQLTAHYPGEEDESCKVQCAGGSMSALIPTWARRPSTGTYSMIAGAAGPRRTSRDQVVLTVLEPAGQITRRVAATGPIDGCAETPPWM